MNSKMDVEVATSVGEGETKGNEENPPPTSSNARHEMQSPTSSTNKPRRKRYKVPAIKQYKRPSSIIQKASGNRCFGMDHTGADPLEDGKDHLVAGSTFIAGEDGNVSKHQDRMLESLNSQALAGQFVDLTEETTESRPPTQTTLSCVRSPLPQSRSTFSGKHQLPPVQHEKYSTSRKRSRRSFEVKMDISSTEGVVKIDHTKELRTENEFLATGIMAVIGLGAKIVASELRRGSWDYVYRVDVANEDLGTTIFPKLSKKERISHLTMAAASIEKFAHDVIVPSFISRGVSDTSSTSLEKTSPNHRVFVGTLLMLRELLIMNADKLFRGSHREEEENSSQSKQQNEERLFRTKILCTTLISKSILNLDAKLAEDIIASFESAVRGYDNGEDEFSSCLDPADSTLKCVLFNGTKLKEMENLSWRVSYNCARSIHPLVQLKKDRDIMLSNRKGVHMSNSSNQIQIPSPNTCFVPMIEKVRFEAEGSDFPELMIDDIPDATVLDFHRKELLRIRSRQRRRYQHDG